MSRVEKHTELICSPSWVVAVVIGIARAERISQQAQVATAET